MTVEYSARSHVGFVRENNEDNLYVEGVMLTPEIRERPFAIDGVADTPAIFAVCDGMGGEEDGEVASLLAVQTLSDSEGIIKAAISERLDETVQSYATVVSETVRAKTADSGKRTGTTLALAIAADNAVSCYNIGDSRIYCYRKAGFRQITNDHTVAAGQIKDGLITASQASELKGGNKLTRCIGIGDDSIVESYPPITGKCRILICSDGLTDLVSADEIETVLRDSPRTAYAADSLLDAALRYGGKDNTTVIVIDVKAPKPPILHSFAKILKG